MAFFRFSRDKRGYEHFYLVQPTNRRGKSRTRVLYWFRTPPNVRVGREPFDAEVRRALEAQHPDVAFDWKTIVDAPIPSAETEKWRERRRAERASRHAAAEDAAAEPSEAEPESQPDEPEKSMVASEGAPPSAGPLKAASAPMPEAGDAARRKRRRRRGRRSGDAAREPQTREAGPAAEPSEPAEPREAVDD